MQTAGHYSPCLRQEVPKVQKVPFALIEKTVPQVQEPFIQKGPSLQKTLQGLIFFGIWVVEIKFLI